MVKSVRISSSSDEAIEVVKTIRLDGVLLPSALVDSTEYE
ncbi:hypothetical protein SNEBB_005462, partial [Seison nebaliae]